MPSKQDHPCLAMPYLTCEQQPSLSSGCCRIPRDGDVTTRLTDMQLLSLWVLALGDSDDLLVHDNKRRLNECHGRLSLLSASEQSCFRRKRSDSCFLDLCELASRNPHSPGFSSVFVGHFCILSMVLSWPRCSNGNSTLQGLTTRHVPTLQCWLRRDAALMLH